MSKKQRFSIIILSILVMHVLVPLTYAHPLGNFTINHYAGLHVKPDTITIDYILDMAEIPAYQEISSIDANRNGQADSEESAGYHPTQCEKIRTDLDLRVSGNRVPLTLLSSEIEFPPGQGGLPTLRLNCVFGTFIQAGISEMYVEFENRSHSNRLGWREIVVTGEDVSLEGEFATKSLSKRLTDYPQDLLTIPLNQRQVSFRAVLSSNSAQEKREANPSQPQLVNADKNDAFTRLILLDNIKPTTFALALVISFIWGAMHAMTPGHGKTIVGAYLVGARGTAKHAFYLGLTTTITHTTGVFVLGLVTFFSAQFILPEKLFPWLSFLSGLLVVGIGANLFFSRLRATGLFNIINTVKNEYPDAHHSFHNHYIHDHTHGHEHAASHHHDHHPGHRSHRDNDKNLAHSSHLPPGADGSPITWRSLLALGISGGLLPCPSALVVLLSAIALNRVGFGLVLVFAFSLGLAGVLTGIGILFVYAGRLFNKIPLQNRLLSLLPAGSALFITFVGLGITARALIETGIIKV